MPLLAVLWGVALVSLIALSLLGTSGTSSKLATNALYLAQIDAAAEAALATTAISLCDQDGRRIFAIDGTPQPFSFKNFVGTIRLQDELGRIDLNFADISILVGLLRSVGVEDEPADRIVHQIAAWRGASPSNGLAYAEGAKTTAARHGPFQSVDELLLVPGMTLPLFRKLLPAITVYSQHQMIDPSFAPREVLLAQPGATSDSVNSAVAARSRGRNDGGSSVSPSLIGHAFAIAIDLKGTSGPRSYHGAFRLVDAPKVFWLLDWRNSDESEVRN